MKQMRESQAEQLLQGLMAYVVEMGANADNTKQQQASLAALLLKKQYLDERAEEEKLWKLNNEQIGELKNQLSSSINFGVQSLNFLKRKADIICKCFNKLDTYNEMIENLVQLLKMNDGTPEEVIKRKQFAMYNFEILAEYHLT